MPGDGTILRRIAIQAATAPPEWRMQGLMAVSVRGTLVSNVVEEEGSMQVLVPRGSAVANGFDYRTLSGGDFFEEGSMEVLTPRGVMAANGFDYRTLTAGDFLEFGSMEILEPRGVFAPNGFEFIVKSVPDYFEQGQMVVSTRGTLIPNAL